LFKLPAGGLGSSLVLDMSINMDRCLICVGLVCSFVFGLGLRVVGFVVLFGGNVVTLLAVSAVDEKLMKIISVRQFICS